MKITITLLLVCPSVLFAEDWWFSGQQKIEATGESLSASDISVESYRLAYSGEEGSWTFDLGLGVNHYRLDYEPVLFGDSVSLGEETWQTDIALTREWNKEWDSTLRFRAYKGFADYRSIWTAEFYRQFFGAFDSYQAPDPHGLAVGASTVWNYLPGSGKAAFNVDFGRDEIAPGWSFNPFLGEPEADRDTLNSLSGSLRVEQALNGWLKSEIALSMREISGRDPRFGIRNTWAAAAGPVAFRLTGGYSEESPAFDAFYGSAMVEWNFVPQWTLNAGYRSYEDSGEIEATGFNAQAPALDSSEIFAGVLWDRGDLAISGSVGFLDTDYAALSADNEFFGNLYRDREWWTFRLAATFRF